MKIKCVSNINFLSCENKSVKPGKKYDMKVTSRCPIRGWIKGDDCSDVYVVIGGFCSNGTFEVVNE